MGQDLEAAAEQAIQTRLRAWWSRLALVWKVVFIIVPTMLAAAGASWAASPHSTIGDHERRISILEERSTTTRAEFVDLRSVVREQTKALQSLDRTVERMSGRIDEVLSALRGEP